MNSSESTKEEREDFIKRLEREAAYEGMSLPEHMIAMGDDDLRDTIRRMIAAELKSK